MIRALAIAGISVLLAAAAPADSAIDANTKCPVVVGYFDNNDAPHTREAYLEIKRVMALFDETETAKGKKSLLTSLSDDEAERVYFTVYSYCRKNPKLTLGQASQQAYEGFRAFMREMAR